MVLILSIADPESTLFLSFSSFSLLFKRPGRGPHCPRFVERVVYLNRRCWLNGGVGSTPGLRVPALLKSKARTFTPASSLGRRGAIRGGWPPGRHRPRARFSGKLSMQISAPDPCFTGT